METSKAPIILMADDDDDDCMLALDAFEESGAKGALVCVENGVELIDYLSGDNSLPALILLDLNMPQKDGRQVLKEIKETPSFKSIPIVVLTTSAEAEDIAYSLRMGAHSFITKPATFGEWVRMMNSLAEKWLAR